MFKPFQETFSFDDVLLVPKYSDIRSRKEVFTKTLISKNKKFFLEIPIISAASDTVTTADLAIEMGKLGGLGVIHRFLPVEDQIKEVKKVKKAGVISAAAFGVKNGEFERAKALIETGVDILMLDVAHAHSKNAIDVIKKVRKINKKVIIIAGTVATREGFYDLTRAGADAIKVGIGGGSICITRIRTGFGVPLLSSIIDCAPIAKKFGVGLIADGGLRTSGDIVKALAAGASAVMLGNMLAGTDQAPGEIIEIDGKKFKSYRGMASLDANLQRKDVKNDRKDIIVEGVSGLVSYKGDANEVIGEILGGIRSGLSYAGARNIKELRKNSTFVRVTQAGIKESYPHDIQTKK